MQDNTGKGFSCIIEDTTKKINKLVKEKNGLITNIDYDMTLNSILMNMSFKIAIWKNRMK